MGTVWTFAETEAYRERAALTARLADLENAVAASEAKAHAAAAAEARAKAEFARLLERVRAMLKTPRATATATRKVADLPVVRVQIGGGRVERRYLCWYTGGSDEQR